MFQKKSDVEKENKAEKDAIEPQKTKKEGIPNELKKKVEEYLNGWKRCQADFENYKKRQVESQKEMMIYANQDLIMQILPVLDNFHASTEHIPEEQRNSAWVAGIMHIQKQLEQVLKDNGAEEIEVKEGDKFDPAFQEAMGNHAGKEIEALEHKIQKIVLKGYKMGEKIIRPVKVIVK